MTDAGIVDASFKKESADSFTIDMGSHTVKFMYTESTNVQAVLEAFHATGSCTKCIKTAPQPRG